MMITRDTRVSAKELDTPEKHAMAVQAFVNAGFKESATYGQYEHRMYEGHDILVVSTYNTLLWDEGEGNTTLEELLSAENSGFNRTESVSTTQDPEWYDYSKQEALTFPPSGIWCQVQSGRCWHKVFIVGMDSDGYCVHEFPIECRPDSFEPYDGDRKTNHFRPLDWDKLSKENLEKAKQRKDLLEIILSAGGVSDGMLADIILNAGFKRNEI